MGNNPELPEGWAMPDDLLKKISEALNGKSITPEDKHQDALDEMARDIALNEPNPVDWAGWVSYLLERLEVEAKRRGKITEFEEMLRSLRQAHDKYNQLVMIYQNLALDVFDKNFPGKSRAFHVY